MIPPPEPPVLLPPRDPAAPPRGRWLPSPTGPLHLGSARTALVAWLSVRSRGGVFVWRVEDLDPPRAMPGAAEGGAAVALGQLLAGGVAHQRHLASTGRQIQLLEALGGSRPSRSACSTARARSTRASWCRTSRGTGCGARIG